MENFMGNFKGTKKNERNWNRLVSLQTTAKKLKSQEGGSFKVNLRFGETDNTHRSCVVSFETSSPMIIMDRNQRSTLAEMILLSDDMSTVYIEEKSKIRFVFGIRDVWEA